MSSTELTADQLSEGVQLAAAATRHLVGGDQAAAFATVRSAPSFAAAVHGLLHLSAIAVAGTGKDPEEFFQWVAMEEARNRAENDHQEDINE